MRALRITYKILRGLVLTALLLVLLALGLVWAFEDKILQRFVGEANEYLRAPVSVERMEVSLFSHFPDATISVHNLTAMAYPAERGDTLVQAGRLDFTFRVWDLLDGNYRLQKAYLYDAKADFFVRSDSTRSFNVLKPDSTQGEGKPLQFALEKLHFENVWLSYRDSLSQAGVTAKLTSLEAGYLHGRTESVARLEGTLVLEDIWLDGEHFGTEKHIELGLDARRMGADWSLEASELVVEKAKFKISGSYQSEADSLFTTWTAEEAQLAHLTALMPPSVAEQFARYEFSGEVTSSGELGWKLSSQTMPYLLMNVGLRDGTLHPEGLPHRLEALNLSLSFTTTKDPSPEHCELTISPLSFRYDEETIAGTMTYRNLRDPFLDLHLKGAVRAEAVAALLPQLPLREPRGRFVVDLGLKGRVKAAQAGEVNGWHAAGTLAIEDLWGGWGDYSARLSMVNGALEFRPERVWIDTLHGNIGQSDFALQGEVRNLLGFLLDERQALDIRAAFQSRKLDLDELLKAPTTPTLEPQKGKGSGSRLVISGRANYVLDAEIGELNWGRLRGDEAARRLRGRLRLKDGILSIPELSGQVAGGRFHLYGQLDGRNPAAMPLDLSGQLTGIDVRRAFWISNDFGQDFISYQHLEGQLTSDVRVSFPIDSSLKVNLTALEVDADSLMIRNGRLAEFQPLIETEEALAEKHLAKYLSAPLGDVRFEELTASLRIRNQEVFLTREIEFQSNAYTLRVIGQHSFENRFSYRLALPMKNYQRLERHEAYGSIERKDERTAFLYVIIEGTPDNFEVRWDKGRTVKESVETIKENIKDIRNPFKPDPEDSRPVYVAPEPGDPTREDEVIEMEF